MKRKSILIVFIVALIAILSLSFVACNKQPSAEPTDNISRETSEYYAGESETFAVTIECGRREKCFIADGKAVDVESFCELKILQLKVIECDTISYLIANESNTLSGSIAKDDNGEFCALITLDFAPTAITLTIGEDSHEIELSNVLNGALSASDIVNVAKTEFADRIQQECGEGALNREIYVKLITGDRISYYYYVSFIGEGTDYWALLIDPKTGAVISRK